MNEGMLAGTPSPKWLVVPVVLAAAAFVGPRAARADDEAVTNQRVALRPTPEESAKPIKYLATGASVTILKRDDRWLYVSAGKTKGWITRTTVVAVSDDDEARSYSWKQKAQKWGDGDGPADAGVGKEVDDEAGDPKIADDSEPSTKAVVAVVPAPRVAISAQLGFRSIGMDFTSDGSESAANYIITAQAATAVVGVHAAGRRGALRFGADVEYRGAYSNPGVRYQASSGGTDDIALTSHEVVASAGAGMHVSNGVGGVDILGRVGYTYGAYLVDELGNLGMLPNESLSGVVVGASIRFGRILDEAALIVDGGVLVGGTREQTQGLEDGMATNASAMWVRGQIAYPLSRHLDLVGEFGYSRRVTVWEGGSARFGDVTRADRSDTLQSFAAGIARSF